MGMCVGDIRSLCLSNRLLLSLGPQATPAASQGWKLSALGLGS